MNLQSQVKYSTSSCLRKKYIHPRVYTSTVVFCQHGCDTSDRSRCSSVTTMRAALSQWLTVSQTQQQQSRKSWDDRAQNKKRSPSSCLVSHSNFYFAKALNTIFHPALKNQQVIKAFSHRRSSFSNIYVSVTSCLNLGEGEEKIQKLYETPPKWLSSPSFLLPHFLQSKARQGKTVCRGGNASAVSQQKTVSSPDQGTEGEAKLQRIIKESKADTLTRKKNFLK